MTRRGLLTLAVAAPFVASLPPTARPALTNRSTAIPTHRRIPIDESMLRLVRADQLPDGAAVRAAIGDRVASTGVISAESFNLVGVTSSSGATSDRLPRILVRTRTSSGWSEWSTLHSDPHAPDDGTSEARTSRPATEPLIVEQSDALDVLVPSDSELATGLDIHLVDPGEDEQIATTTALLEATGSDQPTILTRADWGADETIREPGDPDYGVIRGAFVHHTVNENDYSREDVPGIIRSIYVYHIETRGWRDIGYNFLIDRFGRIWEGRYGGISKPVVGAHTGGYNSSSFGAAVIGTYTNKVPEAAVLQAYQRLIAWKFAMHDVIPVSLVRYPDQRTLPAISGHRDTTATECPGELLYDALPSLRRNVHMSLRGSRTRFNVEPIRPKPR